MLNLIYTNLLLYYEANSGFIDSEKLFTRLLSYSYQFLAIFMITHKYNRYLNFLQRMKDR